MVQILKVTEHVMLYKENKIYCVSVDGIEADYFEEKDIAEEYYQHQLKRFTNLTPPVQE